MVRKFSLEVRTSSWRNLTYERFIVLFFRSLCSSVGKVVNHYVSDLEIFGNGSVQNFAKKSCEEGSVVSFWRLDIHQAR